MAEAVKAGAWAATSADQAGEAVAVAACWLVGVLADDGDGGQHDERPGSVDPGLVDDEKWRQQLLKKMDGDMGLKRKRLRDEVEVVDDGRGRLASCGLCDQRRLAISTDLECAYRRRRDEWLGWLNGVLDGGGFPVVAGSVDSDEGRSTAGATARASGRQLRRRDWTVDVGVGRWLSASPFVDS
ncbi:hypothetical protein ACLOJK_028808 [Asimina triloba]